MACIVPQKDIPSRHGALQKAAQPSDWHHRGSALQNKDTIGLYSLTA